jgi:hypothetical protein
MDTFQFSSRFKDIFVDRTARLSLFRRNLQSLIKKKNMQGAH